MTEEQWESLSRAQQRRILGEMRMSTAKAFFLDNAALERILSGFWRGVSRTKPRPHPTPTEPSR